MCFVYCALCVKEKIKHIMSISVKLYNAFRSKVYNKKRINLWHKSSLIFLS